MTQIKYTIGLDYGSDSVRLLKSCGVCFPGINFSNSKQEKITSLTPLKLALKAFSFALKDSAETLVLLFSTKLSISL